MPTRAQLMSPDYYLPFFANAIRIGLIIVFAYAAAAIANRLIRGVYGYSVKMMARAGGVSDYEMEKRARTVTSVISKTLSALIWVIAALMILKEMNFDVRPLLAGAGVVGVAIGFGAQSVIKDVIGGLFLLMENQIRVNDVVVINGTFGLVEEINLRTTVVRSEEGAVHIFPNGSIQNLANLTREYSYYVFSISVGYKENTDQVIEVMKATAQELMSEAQYRDDILAPLDVLGVDKLGDAAVVIKARIKTLPMRQWEVGREMNRRLKMKFQEALIELPFPSQTIQLAPALPEQLRQELRQIVAEAMNGKA